MAGIDDDLKQSLDLASHQAGQLLIAWRRTGNENYSGQGDAFSFAVSLNTLLALVATRFVERHPEAEHDALMQLAATEPHGVANLEIPEDEIMMHAVTLALIMIRQKQARQHNWPVGEFMSIDNILREAARLTSVLVGGNFSPYVASVAQQTDTDLAEAAERATLFRSEPAGRA